MPLHIITGRANAGKTGAAYDAVRNALAVGRKPVLIVPSAPDARRALVELSNESPLGVRVVTLDEHLAEQWALHGDGRVVCTPGTRRLLLARAAEVAEYGSRGLAQLASRAVEVLTNEVGASWRKGLRVSGPAGVLGRVISEYAEQLDAHDLVEPGEIYHLMAEQGRCGGDPLVVHRFTDFTAAQESFLTQAVAGGHDVMVTLGWEDGFPATAALDELVGRLSAIGVVSERSEDVRGTDPELVRVGSELFGSPTVSPMTGAVRFAEAEGVESEADLIAAEIAVALDEGSRPEDVAVVFSQPESRIGQLRAALEDLGISADYDVLMPFSATPFGRALLQALRFAISGDLTALVGFTRSPFSGVPSDAQRRFERRIRSERCLTAETARSEMEIVSRRAGQVIGVLAELGRDGLTEDVGRELARVARRMLGWAHPDAGLANAGALEEDATCVRALTSLIEDAVAIGEPRVTAGTFETALAQHRIGPARVERAGRVQITGVERVRARRFDVVILGGLNAGEFPRSHDDSLQAGAARALLATYGASELRAADPATERLLFYQLVTRPRRRLVLVRQSHDSDGSPLEPSVFWEELLDFYRPAQEDQGDVVVPRLELGACALTEYSSASERRALRTAVLCGASGTDPRVDSARGRAMPEPAELRDAEALEKLASRDVFSASEIEVYLACPLRWFYERVVRPEALESEFDALERGRFAHEILRVTYQAIMGELPEGRVTSASVERAKELCREAVARLREGQPRPADLEEERDRIAVERAACLLVEADADYLPSAFRPRFVEWDFAGHEGVDMGAFRLRGRIDRVDSDGKHAVVIDYKTGDVKTRAHLLEAGKVQAHLYAEAVRRVTGLQPVASVYWSLKGGKPRGLIDSARLELSGAVRTDCADTACFEADIAHAVRAAEAAVDGMRRGDIAPRPLDGACDYCGAKALCGRCAP